MYENLKKLQENWLTHAKQNKWNTFKAESIKSDIQ